MYNAPADKNLFKVSKITLEPLSFESCSNVMLLTLNRCFARGSCVNFVCNAIDVKELPGEG